MSKKLFFLIRFSDNDFSSYLKLSVEFLVKFLDSFGDKSDLIDDALIKEFLIENVVRMSVMDKQVWEKKCNLEEYYTRTKEYLFSLKVDRGLDAIVEYLQDNSYRKEAIKDLGLDDEDSLKYYLSQDSNGFSLLPRLFWNDQESLIARIELDPLSNLKSQFVVI